MFQSLVFFSIRYTITRNDLDEETLNLINTLRSEEQTVLKEIFDDNKKLVNLTGTNTALISPILQRHIKRIETYNLSEELEHVLPSQLQNLFPSISSLISSQRQQRKRVQTSSNTIQSSLERAEIKVVLQLLINVCLSPEKIEKLHDKDNRNIVHILTCYNAPLSLIREFFDKKKNLNKEDDFKNTYLHYAALYCNEKTVQYFIDQKYNVNALNGEQISPLHYAAQSGNTNNYSTLLKCFAKPTAVDITGNTLMHYAAKGGSLNIFNNARNLLANSDINLKNHKGENFLYSLLDAVNKMKTIDPQRLAKYENTALFLLNEGISLYDVSNITKLTPIDLILGTNRFLKINNETTKLVKILKHPRIKAELTPYDHIPAAVTTSIYMAYAAVLFSHLYSIRSKIPVFDHLAFFYGAECSIEKNPELLAKFSESDQQLLLDLKSDCEMTPKILLAVLALAVLLLLTNIPFGKIKKFPQVQPLEKEEEEEPGLRLK